MKKTFALLASAALLAACGKLDLQEVRQTLPAAETVQIGVPDAAPAAGAGTSRAALASGDAYGSGFARTSYFAALTVNGGVWWMLTLVKFVTAFPPTAHDATSATWGPWVDDDGLNRWKLEVTEEGGAYRWTFSAQPGSRPEVGFTTIVTGLAHPGADRHHGYGTFEVDFEAAADLDHGALWEQEDFGTLAIRYDNRDDLEIDATALGAKSDDPEDPAFMNAGYRFVGTGVGGHLQLAFETIEATPRTVTLHTRWNALGAGRGDAQFSEGGPFFSATECWDGAPASFALTYASHTSPVIGSESACVFADADYADPTILP